MPSMISIRPGLAEIIRSSRSDVGDAIDSRRRRGEIWYQPRWVGMGEGRATPGSGRSPEAGFFGTEEGRVSGGELQSVGDPSPRRLYGGGKGVRRRRRANKRYIRALQQPACETTKSRTSLDPRLIPRGFPSVWLCLSDYASADQNRTASHPASIRLCSLRILRRCDFQSLTISSPASFHAPYPPAREYTFV